ncbi:hypothetical protein IGJ48_002470 [Enterococcus pernyi]
MGKFSQLVSYLDPRKKHNETERPQRKETTVSYRREDEAKVMTRQQKEETCKMLLAAAQKSQENRRRHSPRRLEEKVQTVTVQPESFEVTYADLDLNVLRKNPKPQNKLPETIYAEIKGTSSPRQTEPIYENLKEIASPSQEHLYEQIEKNSLVDIRTRRGNFRDYSKQSDSSVRMTHER